MVCAYGAIHAAFDGIVTNNFFVASRQKKSGYDHAYADCNDGYPGNSHFLYSPGEPADTQKPYADSITIIQLWRGCEIRVCE